MSVHIEAKKGEISEKILLPGDPLRAKWIAENFLENAVCYNKVRGMFGYTGTFKGERISVQATGMGIPSALIYATELITEYGAKKLIRVGSAGSYQKNLKVNDVVLVMSASSNSSFNKARFEYADFAPTADAQLFLNAVKYAKDNNIPVRSGNVLSSDVFYEENKLTYKKWADYGVLCVEMESAGLYTVAAKHKVQALSVLTISDSLVTGEHLPAKEREQSFSRMVDIALGSF
ncbi:purine-nucleoside phosphorylase [Salegentibacter sp. BLCTC]|uniref:purine-nucleoside phosphorylase n=1 Tax=Salegentibacter sp. BLCTC TaxID=2697368 RepID=UPI00187BA5FB|nr:purine-nucleoside phosphorylase [Salegentibacter sp. BLCTC]MBE7638852.1 purine-nucleoside phosphorylase [Salegentibacter sp. BLCTC]